MTDKGPYKSLPPELRADLEEFDRFVDEECGGNFMRAFVIWYSGLTREQIDEIGGA